MFPSWYSIIFPRQLASNNDIAGIGSKQYSYMNNCIHLEGARNEADRCGWITVSDLKISGVIRGDARGRRMSRRRHIESLANVSWGCLPRESAAIGNSERISGKDIAALKAGVFGSFMVVSSGEFPHTPHIFSYVLSIKIWFVTAMWNFIFFPFNLHWFTLFYAVSKKQRKKTCFRVISVILVNSYYYFFFLHTTVLWCLIGKRFFFFFPHSWITKDPGGLTSS